MQTPTFAFSSKPCARCIFQLAIHTELPYGVPMITNTTTALATVAMTFPSGYVAVLVVQAWDAATLARIADAVGERQARITVHPEHPFFGR